MAAADTKLGAVNTAAKPSSLKILVVDDNPSDRMILQAIVKRQGHLVLTAVDGVDAIEKFSSERPDIILLDAMMPRLDGFSTALEIKKLPVKTSSPLFL